MAHAHLQKFIFAYSCTNKATKQLTKLALSRKKIFSHPKMNLSATTVKGVSVQVEIAHITAHALFFKHHIQNIFKREKVKK